MRILFILLMLSACLTFTVPSSAAELDYSKSITIGSGAKTVVEFTDPDCPFCRKASIYFDGRSDTTRHVFFYPLPRHPQAREKAQYILSQIDRGRAYHDAMAGKMDSLKKIDGILPKGVKLQEEQLEIAKKLKINATPTFIINGRIIEGFDRTLIEEALGR